MRHRLPSKKIKITVRGAKKLAPPAGSQPLPHPEDWVTPHTSSKSRQGTWHASMRCHARCSFGLHLPAEWAPEPPRVPRPRSSLPFWCCHVSRGPGPHLLAELSSSAVTCSSAPNLASLSRRRLCHVSKARSRVIEGSARRADMTLQFGSTVQRRHS
jgi:hypothetical protein